MLGIFVYLRLHCTQAWPVRPVGSGLVLKARRDIARHGFSRSARRWMFLAFQIKMSMPHGKELIPPISISFWLTPIEMVSTIESVRGSEGNLRLGELIRSSMRRENPIRVKRYKKKVDLNVHEPSYWKQEQIYSSSFTTCGLKWRNLPPHLRMNQNLHPFRPKSNIE